MDDRRIDRFNQELESILRGHLAEGTGLSPEDLPALELADRLARMDFSSQSRVRLSLRRHLVERSRQLQASSGLGDAYGRTRLVFSLTIMAVVMILFSGILGRISSPPVTGDLQPVIGNPSMGALLASDVPLTPAATPMAHAIAPVPIPTPIAPGTMITSRQGFVDPPGTPPLTPGRGEAGKASESTP